MSEISRGELYHTHHVKGVAKTNLIKKYPRLHKQNVDDVLNKHGIEVLGRYEAKEIREEYMKHKVREEIREYMEPDDVRKVSTRSPVETEKKIAEIFGPSKTDPTCLE